MRRAELVCICGLKLRGFVVGEARRRCSIQLFLRLAPDAIHPSHYCYRADALLVVMIG